MSFLTYTLTQHLDLVQCLLSIYDCAAQCPMEPEGIMLDTCELVVNLSLELGCQTPLPRSSTVRQCALEPSLTKPYTRLQAKLEQRNEEIPNSSSTVRQRAQKPSLTKPYTRLQAKLEQQNEEIPNSSSTNRQKRNRKSEFDIFVDDNTNNTTATPSPKKLKANERVPLSINTDIVNTVPNMSPQQLDAPFLYSPLDPLWEDVENYDTCPFYMTPPATPARGSPSSSPTASIPPSPSASPAPRRQKPTAAKLSPPKDKLLYTVLKLDDWQATEQEIKMAYRKIAARSHPDKASEKLREGATHTMQTVNAAKEVLLDSKRRRAYHRSGKLPWST